MNSREIKDAFKNIECIANNNNSLKQSILAHTTKQKATLTWLAKVFASTTLFAFVILFILPTIQSSFPIFEAIDDNLIEQSIAQLHNISAINSSLLLILSGSIRVFIKLSFLAFILTAAAMPGPLQKPKTGEMQCPD
jgi:hypothetical protein